jgi:ACT domain-containing protein
LINRRHILRKIILNLREETIQQVEKVRLLLNSRTKAQAIADAVNLADLIICTIQKGGEVVLTQEDGVQEKIVINRRE